MSAFLADWWLPLTILGGLASAVGIWLGAWLIIRLPANHFVCEPDCPKSRHPAVHAMIVLFRSLMGLLLIGIGLVLLVAPGQGVLTILLGISLIPFPGKAYLVQRILKFEALRNSLNWMRRRAGRPPLKFPALASSAGKSH